MPIRIARGQRKTVQMEFFQGDENSLPMDLTAALFSIYDANFPAQAEFEAVDLPNGIVNLVITSEGSRAMRPNTINWLRIKTQIGNWEDVSAPIQFEATAL